MQDQSMLQPSSKEKSASKSKKKKSSSQRAPSTIHELQAPPFQTAQKPSKRGLVNEPTALYQQPDRSSESLPDSAPSSENDYRALRRKYLLLEEESFGLDNELKAVEDEIKTLEEEKVGLLDELVVLEGLVDPSEIHSKGHH